MLASVLRTSGLANLYDTRSLPLRRNLGELQVCEPDERKSVAEYIV